MDEPTAEWILTRQRFWEIVGHLKEEGVTIVYSSHYIEEVEHTADLDPWSCIRAICLGYDTLAMRSEEVEKHFTLPLRYQALVTEMEGIMKWLAKPDALQVVHTGCQSFVDSTTRRRMFDPRNRSKQSKFIDSIFECHKEVGREDETHESPRRWRHLTRRRFIITCYQLGCPRPLSLLSGMYQETPGAPAHFMRDYLLSMTAFSMVSTAIFFFSNCS